MLSTRLISTAALLAFSTAGVAATAPATKPEAKPAAKAATKAAAKAAPGPRKLRGKMETLACRLGTEDRHARIAVVTIGGTVDSFAYYSKWKPRTCSVYLQRDRDMYSKWADTGAITTVNIEKGAFLIENKKGEYHFIFRDVDRERYCGMDGVINGSLTIRKGSEACVCARSGRGHAGEARGHRTGSGCEGRRASCADRARAKHCSAGGPEIRGAC
jgi:hypothetical protein